MTKKETYTLLDTLKDSYDKTYVADGVDSIDALLPENRPDYLTRISSFLGLPNRILDKNKGQSVTNLFYNFIGYQENVTDRQRQINNILRTLVIFFNILLVPFKLFSNVVKSGTEFVPALATNFFGTYLGQILQNATENEKNNKSIRILSLVGQIVSFVAYFASNWIYFLGYAITSPINSVREQLHKDSFLGVIFSMSVTFAAYALIFPFAALSVLTQAPMAVSNTIVAAMNLVGPALGTIGNIFATATNFISTVATFGLVNFTMLTSTLPPGLVGIGGLVGIFVSTAGVAISHQIDRFKNWLHKPAPAEKVNSQNNHVGESNSHQLVNANLLQDKQKETVANQVKVENTGSNVSLDKKADIVKTEAPVKLSVASTLYSKQEESGKEISKEQETITPAVKMTAS